MKVSEEAALAILEVVTSRVGARLEKEDRDNTLSEILLDVGNDFEALVDAADLQHDMIAERLTQLAATCVIAVASMVAGSGAVEEKPEGEAKAKSKYIDMEDAAIRARELMINRAKKNIPPPDHIS
jgi:hypothetical protein